MEKGKGEWVGKEKWERGRKRKKDRERESEGEGGRKIA